MATILIGRARRARDGWVIGHSAGRGWLMLRGRRGTVEDGVIVLRITLREKRRSKYQRYGEGEGAESAEPGHTVVCCAIASILR